MKKKQYVVPDIDVCLINCRTLIAASVKIGEDKDGRWNTEIKEYDDDWEDWDDE